MIRLTREIDRWIQIGDDIFVSPTDLDGKIVRVIARGRMLGGADDGGTFTSTHELSAGQSFSIGPWIVITLLGVRGGQISFGVLAPPKLGVVPKESIGKASNDVE